MAPPLPEGNPFVTIDQHLSEHLVKLICDDKFVDLSKLALQSPVDQEDKVLQFVQMHDGETAYKPKQELHKVDGLIKYLRAMFIYGTSYLKKFPTRAPEFLLYLHSILDADKQYKWTAVYTYDQKFRLHWQKNPSHSWAQINWEFCNELATAHNFKEYFPKFSPNKSYKFTSYAKPPYRPRLMNTHTTPGPFGPQQQQCCFKDFNWNSCTCKDCKYLHACEKCKVTSHKTPGCLSG